MAGLMSARHLTGHPSRPHTPASAQPVYTREQSIVPTYPTTDPRPTLPPIQAPGAGQVPGAPVGAARGGDGPAGGSNDPQPSLLVQYAESVGAYKNLQPSKAYYRLVRYALQAMMRQYLCSREKNMNDPWRRLAGCHVWLRGSNLDVVHEPRRMRAYYRGLQTCGSAWACPVCSGVIYDLRKTEVASALAWARDRGTHVLFVTFTIRHTSQDALAGLLDKMGAATRHLYQSRGFRALKEKYGFLGSIKGIEITHGDSGWHPHSHSLFFFERCNIVAIRAEVDRLWLVSLAAVGLSGLSGIACTVKESSYSAAEYMTKFEKPRRWDLDAELTMWARKDGRSRGSISPWDLLRPGPDPRDQETCRMLFVEYAIATKGRASLVWSPGLKAAVGLKDVSDDQATDGELNDRDLDILARLSPAQWGMVLANDCRAELLQVADSGDVQALALFLACIGVVVAPIVEMLALPPS